MSKCPVCGGALKLNKIVETGKLAYIRCKHQKTEKKGSAFVEVGKCKFKINFSSKLYTLTQDEMKKLLGGDTIKIKDGNTMTLDLKEEMFTKIDFTDKYKEEDF